MIFWEKREEEGARDAFWTGGRVRGVRGEKGDGGRARREDL